MYDQLFELVGDSYVYYVYSTKVWRGKTLTNEPFTKLQAKLFDKLIVGFKGEALKEEGW